MVAEGREAMSRTAEEVAREWLAEQDGDNMAASLAALLERYAAAIRGGK